MTAGHSGRRAAGAVLLVACLTAGAAAASPGEPGATPAPTLSLDGLAGMSWPDLEGLYRASDAGAVPTGFAAGRAIYCQCRRFAGVRSKAADALWRGKVFDDSGSGLINQWRFCRAIRAHVYYGPSLLDGKPAVIMDYGQTSWVWADVRDEMREVAPGLYLGRMYRGQCGRPKFQIFFALQACASRP